MSLEAISDPSLLTIFAYAPAGFGHLRVTDALIDGIPRGARHPLVLGSHDPVLEWLHRISSNNTIVRSLFEWSQYGVVEDMIATFYKWYLRNHTDAVYNQLLTILDQRFDRPSRILIIATHFALAHQIGQIKKRFEEDKKIPLTLVVQVTDDSPQHMWYVPEADMTYVPSEYTKKALLTYASEKGMKRIPIEVSPYPINTIFTTTSHKDFCTQKLNQVLPDATKRLHVVIPISGAAAGLAYLMQLISTLHRQVDRFYFHVVVKKSSFTRWFVSQIMRRSFVDIHDAYTYRDAVNKYEDVYIKHTIALEITKPSEQAFKALLQPTQQGGSILLFASPIGRQEKDNLEFLRRHELIPNEIEKEYLWNHIQDKDLFATPLGKAIHKKAGDWRGLELPKNAKTASDFVVQALEQGLLMRMMNCKVGDKVWGRHAREISPDGVEIFWSKVNKLLM